MKYNRRHIPNSVKEEVFSQTSGACYYCGYAATDIDHVIPHSYVANNSETNLVACCSICNSIAANRHFENLQAKKNYILSKRNTLKRRRQIGKMIVTIIGTQVSSMPKSEQLFKPSKPALRKRRPITALLAETEPGVIIQQVQETIEHGASKIITIIEPEDDSDSYYSKDDPEGFVFSLPEDELAIIVEAIEVRHEEDRCKALALTLMGLLVNGRLSGH